MFFDHGVVGKAIKGPICTHQFSGGVNMVSCFVVVVSFSWAVNIAVLKECQALHKFV